MFELPYTLIENPLIEHSPIEKPSAAEAAALIHERIVAILEERQGERTHAELAREIGISRPMLRAVQLFNSPPGLDTLSMLIDWDEDTFLPLAIDYIKHRGSLLRAGITPRAIADRAIAEPIAFQSALEKAV